MPKKSSSQGADLDREGSPTVERHRHGVWEMALLSEPTILQRLRKFQAPLKPSFSFVDSIFQDIPQAVHFFTEVYHIAPRQFIVYMLGRLWSSAEGGLSLYLTSSLLELIGCKLQGQDVSGNSIIRAIISKCVFELACKCLDRLILRDEEILVDRIKLHFALKSMQSSMNLSLATADDLDTKNKLGMRYNLSYEDRAWKAFNGLSIAAFSISRICLQALIFFSIFHTSQVDNILLAICLALPFINHFAVSTSLWGRAHVVYCVDASFDRMAALYSLAFDEKHRSDRLSDGVGEYITKEYNKQREMLGDKCTASVDDQRESRVPILAQTIISLSSDLPLIVFGINILFNVNELSFTSLSIMQRASETIFRTYFTINWAFQNISSNLTAIRNIYSLEDMSKTFVDGDLKYPSVGSKHGGAEIEFRDVSFAYPGEKKNAIDGISFTIKPGQLVVIVGVNGSGKSSLIKLFNRLYDTTSGTILLDGIPIRDYRVSDVRRSMAILRQDHTPYPLSIRDNIILGVPERVLNNKVTMEELDKAAEKGGATSFIKKLQNDMDTVLKPSLVPMTCFPSGIVSSLKSIVDERGKKVEISGGESQRLAASRTFMRINGDGIRFLAADEATSAMDPEGEFELLSNLKELRGDKTVVLITHRFGHLTRFADLILCIKDGKLVEQGTHVDLMTKGGEYYKLHNIQSQAFAPN